MKNRQKVFIVIAAIVLGTFLTWYLQVYKHKSINDSKKEIVVSIPPLKYLVNQIVDDDFNITTLLPEGMSPETYEPTPRQIIAASKSEIIFATGLLDFEKTIINKVQSTSNAPVATLFNGIQLIEGTCNHDNIPEPVQYSHNHGVDPHIWTSLHCLQIMAENAYNSIKTLYPDSGKYYNNYKQLIKTLEDADSEAKKNIVLSGIKYFLIYHPALAYYARDYNISQVALEYDGKEPTADRMKSVIEQARQDSIKTILYQKQLSESVVETAAKDIGAEPVAFDPLAEDVVQNLLWVTDIITRR